VTGPSHPPLQPVGSAQAAGRDRQSGATKFASPSRTLALCLGSLAVMAPWPLLLILLMRPQFESPSDAYLFFGGITMFPLMVLALFGTVSEGTLVAIFMAAWLAAALVPDLWLRKRLASRRAIVVLLGAQALFSLAQGVMGALLLIGRSI
jgi:hypothetical protein